MRSRISIQHRLYSLSFATEHADAEPSPERCRTTTAGGRATARRGPPDDRGGAVFLGRHSGGGGRQCAHRSGATKSGRGGFLDPLVSDSAKRTKGGRNPSRRAGQP